MKNQFGKVVGLRFSLAVDDADSSVPIGALAVRLRRSDLTMSLRVKHGGILECHLISMSVEQSLGARGRCRQASR